LLIAGPNLTVDRTSTLPELRPGEVLRLANVVVTPGGKGLNVARAARALGVPAALVAFLPGYTGRAVAAMIAEEGVTLQGVPTSGELRSTSVILEPSGRATVLNEPGPPVDDEHWVALEACVDDALVDHRVLVCSGSLPPGAPVDGYARLVARTRDAGAHAVVDAGGPILAAALGANPDVVAPNLAEAEGVLFGRADEAVEASPDARDRALAAARGLVHRGARAAVVTAAAAGAAVAWDAEPVWLQTPRVEVSNPIGAGDVLTSALAAALERGASVLHAAREGVAAAAASVEAPKAGELDRRRMQELLARLAA
jgi:1-phosphofructokinase family hexose kinase